jgi:ribosomal protein S18 acetylase RimI-like enzyme
MVSFLRKIIRRLFRRPQFKQLVIVTRRLDGSLPAYQARIPFDFEVLPPDIEEIEARLAHIPAEHRPDIERRIQHGHLCCVAKHNGQIIFVSWIAFGTCYSYVADREYELADDEAYLYSAYTLSEFRGNGLHPAGTWHRLQLLKNRGYKRALNFIEPKNSAAMRMPEKLGYEKVGVTGFIEVFGFRWYFHKDRGAFSALKKRNYWRKM